MASMLLISRQATSLAQGSLQIGPITTNTNLKYSSSPIASWSSTPTLLTAARSGSREATQQHVRANPLFSNSSTIISLCSDRSRENKLADRTRTTVTGSRFDGRAPSRVTERVGRSGEHRLGACTRRRATVTRAQYDGKAPSGVTEKEREEWHSENGLSSSKLDSLLDPAHVRESQRLKKKAISLNDIEEKIERTIFDFRFLTLFGVVGSLLGAVLCFLKGCLFVAHSYREYIRACFGGGVHTSRVILYLVEAVDVYLMGTVMLIFGMGLYELFVSSLEVPGGMCRATTLEGGRSTVCGSNLFGLFRLRERPKWLEIRSLDELKTKLGHVIVMILLVGMFEKSKKVIVHTSMDFLCFSASILLSSGALYLLSMLHQGSNSSQNEMTNA